MTRKSKGIGEEHLQKDIRVNLVVFYKALLRAKLTLLECRVSLRPCLPVTEARYEISSNPFQPG